MSTETFTLFRLPLGGFESEASTAGIVHVANQWLGSSR